MGFYVQNNTPNTIWVAVAHYDPNCSPTTYVKEGWYRIIPGRRSLIVSGSSANQNYYIYGFDNFNHTWGGNFNTYVPVDRVFTMCWVERCRGTGCNRVGFDQISVGNFQNYTLNLINGTNVSKLRNTLASKKGGPKFKLERSSIKKLPGKVGSLGKVIKPLRG